MWVVTHFGNFVTWLKGRFAFLTHVRYDCSSIGSVYLWIYTCFNLKQTTISILQHLLVISLLLVIILSLKYNLFYKYVVSEEELVVFGYLYRNEIYSE